MDNIIKSEMNFSLDSLLGSLSKTDDSKTEKHQSKQERVSYWSDHATKEDLSEMVVAMAGYMEKLVDSLETQEDLNKMGEEYLAWEKITDFMESRKKSFRTLFFEKLDDNFSKEAGETPAHQIKGSMVAETSQGKLKFCREGGGRKNPSVDQEKLKEILGHDRFDKLIERKEVPAHVVEEFSEERFVGAVYAGEITHEEAREALVPGPWQTPRFVVRRQK